MVDGFEEKLFWDIGIPEKLFLGEGSFCFPGGLDLEKPFGYFVSGITFYIVLARFFGGRNTLFPNALCSRRTALVGPRVQ